MSLSLFKQSMLSYMQNQPGIESGDAFAEKITKEYDNLIKMGFQTLNNVRIEKGNVQGMESQLKLACSTAQSKTEGLHTFLDDVGKGIVAYWQGAQLSLTIPPTIPAPPGIVNLQLVAAIIDNPGTAPVVGPLQPNDDSNIMVNQLALMIQQHALTITGTYYTVTLFPAVPAPTPGPGTLPFSGWTIPQ